MPMITFEVSSAVSGAAEEVWARCTSPEGINHELMPIMRMTIPGPMRGRTIADVEPGTKLGRSWLLLLGFLPFDYDDIGIAELGPGCRFLERSTMLSMRRWQHERTVTPDADGRKACEVKDRITFELRRPLASVPYLGPLLRSMLMRVFHHRHARLVGWFR
jgi:hypothetical protein